MKIKIRKFVLLSAITALLTTMTVPSSADKPVDFPVPPAEFDDFDPCTGEIQSITIFLDVLLHQHKNNFVATVVRTGFTSAGYQMFAGTQVQLQNFNGGIFGDRFVDMWRNDDGRMFQAAGNFVFDTNTNEVRVEHFNFQCIGGDTIL